MRHLLALLAVFCFLAPALAQDTSALVNEALDKQVKFNLDATLPQALRQIETDTGVPLRAAPDVYALLPWGEQTNIKAKIENQTLRQALEALTRKLGLTFDVLAETVEIRPIPPFKRLGRRATLHELQVLDLLASTSLNAPADRLSIRQLLASVDAKLESAKSGFAIENRFFDRESMDKEIAIPRNATLMDALESIPKSTAATWYPWGQTLVVVAKEEPVRNRLARPISVRFDGLDIAQVLTELASRAGVTFTIEPGALQRISPESRTVRLVIDNASVQQALESIAGVTGLSYAVNENGVYLWNASTPAANNREPSIGLLQLDNGMQVIIRESQVPPDIREYLKYKTQKHFQNIRQQMKEEGFKPSTQPTTAPATRPADERL